MKLTLIPLALIFAGSAHAGTACDMLQSEIEAKIRANGVSNFTLNAVDASASTDGRVVGSCEQGSKKIVYSVSGGQPAAAEPAPQRSSPSSASPAPGASATKPRAKNSMLTECRDGTVITSGDCKN